MNDSLPPSTADTFPITNHFVRDRNVLVSSANMESLFGQWADHQEQFQIQSPAAHRNDFLTFLAGFALHTAAYPRTAILAWTIHFQDPRLNVFLAGDAGQCTVAGRLFTEGLRNEASNMFYQDLILRGKPPHRSIVPFEGNHPRGTMEFYYTQSEQRPGKFFDLGNGEHVLVSAHPDYDAAWFRNLSADEVSSLPSRETLSHIETRHFKWHCGCHYNRIEQILVAPMASDPDALFGNDEVITVNCPRCAARFRISRESMEAAVVKHLNSGSEDTSK